MSGLGELQMVRSGWLEKYSVGRGIIPFKNWQRRWFCVDHGGLNYAKAPTETPSRRTFIPFVAGPGATGDVVMAPVFLYPDVTEQIHSEAIVAGYHYFALRFQERGTPRLLLVRIADKGERDSWVRFLAQFVHAAALSGIPAAHPTVYRKGIDPDELDPRERAVLKQAVMDWDEGMQNRAAGNADPLMAPESIDDCAVWNSDDESHNPSRRGSKSATQSPAVQSPRGRPHAQSHSSSPAGGIAGRSGPPASSTPPLHQTPPHHHQNPDEFDCL